MSEPPLPTVGRIVHYYAQSNSVPYAAIVTGVKSRYPYCADLYVFLEDHTRYTYDVMWSEKPEGGFWTWPPRV